MTVLFRAQTTPWPFAIGRAGRNTLREGQNYAHALVQLRRFEEAKTLLRKLMPVAQRILGDNGYITLLTRSVYAKALYEDPGATLEDLREAVTTLEEIERTARRVLGGTHPLTMDIEDVLRGMRAALRDAVAVGHDSEH